MKGVHVDMWLVAASSGQKEAGTGDEDTPLSLSQLVGQFQSGAALCSQPLAQAAMLQRAEQRLQLSALCSRPLAQAAMLQRAEQRLELRKQVHHRNLQHAVAQLLAKGWRLQHFKQVAHSAAVWATGEQVKRRVASW